MKKKNPTNFGVHIDFILYSKKDIEVNALADFIDTMIETAEKLGFKLSGGANPIEDNFKRGRKN